MIFFIVTIVFMLMIEYRHYKTCITPFFILGGIYLFGTVLSNTLGIFLGYNAVSLKTMFLFSVYLFIIFLEGTYFRRIPISVEQKVQKDKNIYTANATLLFMIFLVALLGYALSMVLAIRSYGFGNIKGKSGGILGHLGLMAVAISPMITKLFFDTKKIRYLFSVLLLLAISVLFGGKYYIFITVVASALVIFSEKKISFRKLIEVGFILLLFTCIAFLCIYGVFPLIQSGNFSLYAVKDSMFTAMEHLFYYFASPFLCSNTYFQMPIANGFEEGLRVVFNPIDTILEAALGTRNFANIIMEDWVPISVSAYRQVSNVGGIFSETVYRIGYLGTAVYMAIVAFVVYFVYDMKNRKHIFHGTTSILVGIFGLCFFCNFFSLLSVFEVIVYSIIMDTILTSMYRHKIEMHIWRTKKRWKIISKV